MKAYCVSINSKGSHIRELEINRFDECVVFDDIDNDDIAIVDDGFSKYCKTREEAVVEALRISEKRLAMMQSSLDKYQQTVDDLKDEINSNRKLRMSEQVSDTLRDILLSNQCDEDKYGEQALEDSIQLAIEEIDEAFDVALLQMNDVYSR